MKITIRIFQIFFLQLVLSHSSSSQSFKGKLTYIFENIVASESLSQNLRSHFSKDLYKNELNGSVSKYIIKEDKLRKIDFQKNGDVDSECQQIGNEAFLILSEILIKDYFEDPAKKTDNLKLLKKTKKTKDILGYHCRKYLYLHPDGYTKIEAWIAEDFHYDKKKQSNKYFSTIFLPHGLAMEKTMIFRSATNRWTLTKIEEIDVPDDTFNFFFTKDKKKR